MDHALIDALRSLTRFEIGARSVLRELDDDPLLVNASLAQGEGVFAEGPELHFIAGEESYGTLDDDVLWEELG